MKRIVPVVTVFQKGNTSQIGETMQFRLVKGQNGFGFSFAGRESFANERKEYLYYVKGIRGINERSGLKAGDRILQVSVL